MDFPIEPTKRMPIVRRGDKVDNQEKQRHRNGTQQDSKNNKDQDENQHNESDKKPYNKEGGFEFEV